MKQPFVLIFEFRNEGMKMVQMVPHLAVIVDAADGFLHPDTSDQVDAGLDFMGKHLNPFNIVFLISFDKVVDVGRGDFDEFPEHSCDLLFITFENTADNAQIHT